MEAVMLIIRYCVIIYPKGLKKAVKTPRIPGILANI
jgi:hypothetical protein